MRKVVALPLPTRDSDSATTEQLTNRNAGLTAFDQAAWYSQNLAEQRVEQERQANRFRNHFYVWAVWVVSSVILGAFAVIGLYLCSQWGHLDASVMVTFLGTTVVCVLLLGSLIARYLFPSHASGPEREP